MRLFDQNRDGAIDGNDRPTNLWSINVDGSGAHNLTHADSDEDAPSVSPDGNWIAFTRYTAKGRTDVFMMPIEGGEAMPLTTGEADDSAPVWVWPK